MLSPTLGGRRGGRGVVSGALLGAAAIVLAGALPVAALLVAGRSATAAVRQRAYAGSQATATAVAGQAGQRYQDAVDYVASARTGVAVVAGAADTAAAKAVVPRLRAMGPYSAVAIYDRAGVLLAAARDRGAPLPSLGAAPAHGVAVGPIVAYGSRSLRRVTAAIQKPGGGERVGTLVADVDLSRLLTHREALHFGRTGLSKLVGTDGRVLLSADPDVGTMLLAPQNRRVARAHRPATLTVFTPFYHRNSVEAYAPVSNQPFGVLTQQAESEAFAAVHRLATRLRQLEAGFAIFGAALGAAVIVAVRRRDRRIVRMTTIASVAQQAVLPILPAAAGPVTVAARYLSAAEDAVVGGDLYDCYHSPTRTRFLIADVRGKGLSAVEQAARVIRAFRQSAALASGLAAVAQEMSAYLEPFLDDEEFVTALLLDVTDPLRLTVVSAGHPPPLLVTADGAVSYLEAPAGLPLGFTDQRTEMSAMWVPGDRLLLYTDGLVKARDRRGRFLALDELAPPLVNGDPGAALDELLDQVRGSVPDGRLADDLAVVLLQHVAPQATRGTPSTPAVAKAAPSANPPRGQIALRVGNATAAEATRRLAATFEEAPVGMLLVDLSGRVLQVNLALATMLGAAPEALVGRELTGLVDPRDVDGERGDRVEVMAGRIHRSQREIRLLDADGEPIWTMVNTALVRDAAGEPAHLVLHVQDIRGRKQYEGRLQYLADHDPLTGLFNRRRFDSELNQHLAEHARYGGNGAVLLLDLDNFKYVNDTLGHSAGDALIRAVAAALRRRIRTADILGRLGGDEFAVLLPGADTTEARAVAAALLDAIRAASATGRGAVPIRTTASLGVALLPDVDEPSAEAALAAADLAMYAAKDQGRDRAVVYDPTGPHLVRAEAQFRWLHRIRAALEHDQLTLQAQPIVEIATGRTTQIELLLRMREGQTLIPPDRFLYIAERHGLGPAIDRWVIDHAISHAATLTAADSTRVEINLCADSLADPDLPAHITDLLADRHVPANRIVFEVTETAAIANIDTAVKFVEQLEDVGCAFALDDFGAGFGSFYYLKHLPFDYLKIDGEFIRQLTSSSTDQHIVTSIVAAAHGLGKQTVAEYVGDAATLEMVGRLGVDYAQGYHLGHPANLPAPAVAAQRGASAPRPG